MRIYLGKKKSGDKLYLDFEKEDLHFILLHGVTGSGKSIFHENLYKQLVGNYIPKELGFVFIDNTNVDFSRWENSPYVYKQWLAKEGNRERAINILEEMAEKSKRRAEGKENNDRLIFTHIEEYDLFHTHPERTKKAIEGIIKYASKSRMFVVYSTSRLSLKSLPMDLAHKLDLKVAFESTSTVYDRRTLLPLFNPEGILPSRDFEKPGERLLVFNGKKIYCKPFTPKEVKKLRKYTGKWLNPRAIKVKFGDGHPPKDEKFIKLYTKMLKGKLPRYFALIKAEGVIPFSDFKPDTPEDYKKVVLRKIENKHAVLHVYQEGNKFIMSDDYHTYYIFKQLGLKKLPCLVVGEPKGKYVIDKRPAPRSK